MRIVNDYLQYLDEQHSAWKKRVSSGQLDPEKVRHLAKPEEEYMKGVEKGSANIAKKTGAYTTTTKLANYLGPMASGQTVHLPQGDPKFFRFLVRLKGLKLSKEEFQKILPLLKRHEYDEVNATIKQMRKFEQGKGPVPSVVSFQKKGLIGKKLVGKHMGPEVLKKEKKLTDYYSKMYPNPGIKKFTDFRNKTGEYKIASLPKNKMKKLEKHLSKLRGERAKSIEDAMKRVAYFKQALKNKNYTLANKFRLGKETVKSALKAGKVYGGVAHLIK